MKFGLILILVLTSTTITCCFEIQVKAKTGEDVTLQGVSVSGNISLLEWTRVGLAQDKYVFLYRDDNVDEGATDQRFKGRVTRKDSKTDIILKNVTVSDTGIYLCLVVVEENLLQKGVVNLMVTDGHHGGDGGSRDSHVSIASVAFQGVIAVAVVFVAVGVMCLVVGHRDNLCVKKAGPEDGVPLNAVSVSGDFNTLE